LNREINDEPITLNSELPRPDSNEMAVDRTWLAHERTLMAWVRTATSMISFGFTIYKFFEFEAGKNASAKPGLLTPRDFALIMISIGLVSLLGATIGHRRAIRSLSVQLPGRRSLAELVAFLIAIFGILLLLATVFRQ
jgi:putative membrane protein